MLALFSPGAGEQLCRIHTELGKILFQPELRLWKETLHSPGSENISHCLGDLCQNVSSLSTSPLLGRSISVYSVVWSMWPGMACSSLVTQHPRLEKCCVKHFANALLFCNQRSTTPPAASFQLLVRGQEFNKIFEIPYRTLSCSLQHLVGPRTSIRVFTPS